MAKAVVSYLSGLKLKTKAMTSLANLDGLVSISDGTSSTVETKNYYGLGGYSKSQKTKMSVKYTVNCDRIKGDEANDAIFALRYAIGDDAEVEFEYTFADGTVETFTGIVDVTSFSGGDSVVPMNFDIYVDGKPVVKGAVASE